MTRYSPQWKEKIVQPVYNSQDIEYFQGMYPQQIKELQRYVISHCDTMDYAGSPIYDEYPDPLMLDRACDAICQSLPERLKEGNTASGPDLLEEENVEVYEAGDPQMEATEWNGPDRRPPGGPPPGGRPPGGPPPWGPPPPPPGGRPPGGPPPWGPPPPPGRPPGSPPPWGPPPPPGRPPGGPPPWGPPPPPPAHPPGGSLISDVIKVLLMNELQRRRCRTGMC